MEKIPLEVFLRIISYVEKTDKFNCLQVCKSWCNNIQTSTKLYQKVIVNDPHKFDCFFIFFGNHKNLGGQVKDLQIDNTHIDIYAFLMLPVLFPKVEKFCFQDNLAPIREWNHNKEIFSGWAKNMKSIVELGAPVFGPALLSSQLCNNLTSLTLGFLGYENALNDQEFISHSKQKEFISHLKNAPNLTCLTMQWLNLTLSDMEKLFSNTQNLKAIGFYQVGFEPGILQGSITPAEKMETVIIDGGYFLSIEDHWIPYFAQKCVNLRNFMLTMSEDVDIMDDIHETLETKLSELIMNCRRLEYYHVTAIPLTADILNLMDSKQLKLKKLGISDWDILDDLESVANSVQKDSIESLTFSSSSYFEPSLFEFEQDLIDILKKFPKLKHLRMNKSKKDIVGQYSNVVPLDSIIEHLDLESITMDFAIFRINSEDEKPYDTNLKKLVLEELQVEASKFRDMFNKDCISESDWLSYDQISAFHRRSLKFLKQKLPNTKIIERGASDKGYNDEYAHLFQID